LVSDLERRREEPGDLYPCGGCQTGEPQHKEYEKTEVIDLEDS